MRPRPGYASYLLQMWQVHEQDHVGWRVLLHCTATGAVRGFPDLESLFLFLRGQDHDLANYLNSEGSGDD